ncbi:TrkA C-terminal domain-containing protein [Desulfohalovibrio reitneri]|uniref:TrkA C-terminal domain-containing protein n=1 Tax=Desulfohalovibrio reitneri TaxID=1307759 RepID=UPI00055696F4|nr:TrkA C-terminal domain-containing protein [Desulfohalovibrio reitneri]
MIAVLTFLIVVSLSLIVTRIAAVALAHTGLSEAVASFQARSAFSGVGYTTIESESIVNHPVRRRIVLHLMLLGNAGLVTAISSLVITFMDVAGPRASLLHLIILLAGLMLLWRLAASNWVNYHLSNIITWALSRYTDVEVQDYVNLLHLGEYRVTEMRLEEDYFVVGHSLQDLHLKDLGIQVLGVTHPDGSFTGTPGGDLVLRADDHLLLYCRTGAIRSINWRRGTEYGQDESVG